MTLKLSPTGHFDGMDREEMRRMIESAPFQAVQLRIGEELKRATQTCVNSQDQLEVMRAQGAARALETVLHTPERLLDEMKPR
jgi:hypothetical protein